MKEKYVLIVNQDSVIGSIIKRVIHIDNAIFGAVHYFSEVEEVLKKQSIDLVITDLNIDGIGTNEYISFLHKKLPNIPILVTSHMDHTAIKSEIGSLGITEFIPLPLKINVLRSTIKKYL